MWNTLVDSNGLASEPLRKGDTVICAYSPEGEQMLWARQKNHAARPLPALTLDATYGEVTVSDILQLGVGIEYRAIAFINAQ